MDARLDPIELDDVNEGLDIGPVSLMLVWRVLVRQTPKLRANTRKLKLY